MQLYDMAGLTMALGHAALAAGTTTTLTTSNAINVVINGKTYTLAAITNVQPATTDAATGVAPKAVPPGYGCIFIIGALKPASGVACSTTLGYVQSELVPIEASASGVYTAGAFIDLPEIPANIPDTFCPIGYITCRVASTNSASYTMFTSGTTATGAQNSNTTGFANLYGSLSTLPSRPIAS